MDEFNSENISTEPDYLSSVIWLSFLLLIVVVAGCSDSKTTVGPDPVDESITIQGSVNGPADVAGNSLAADEKGNNLEISESDSGMEAPGRMGKPGSQSAYAMESAHYLAEGTLSGEVPLNDVKISLYELSDYITNESNATLIATTNTDAEGVYTFSEIDEGLDLVVLVESNPRLTSVIPGADDESNGNVNTSTAIVSEYWAGEIANGHPFNQGEFDEMIQTADDLLSGMSANELYEMLLELVPDQFGDGFPDNLTPSTKLLVDQLTGQILMSCEDIEFSIQSSQPGSFIIIRNIPVELGEDPFAWMHIDNEVEELIPVYIGRNSDDGWELLVPMHPVNHLNGGSVQIFIESEDAQVRCGDYNLEIEPLEPAPGTFQSKIDEFETTAISITEMIGYSREELLSKNINELDSYAAVMKSVLTVIGGPEYPGSLRYSLDNTTSNEVLEIYDALLSRLSTSDEMSKHRISVKSDTPFLPDVIPCDISLNDLSGEFAIPEDLDCWMNVNRVFEEFSQSEFQTYQDIIRRATPVMGTIFFPQDPENELVGQVEAYLNFMEMMLASFEFLFPSELLGIDLEGEPLHYNYEDDDTEGYWEASIFAQPKDWEFDALLSIGVLPVPGLAKSAGIIRKFRRQSEVFEKVVEVFLSKVQSEIQSTGIGQYTFEAQVFGPIEIDTQRDEDYFTWELNTKSQETNMDPFSFTQDEKGYTPEAVGTADLRVESKGGDVFKGQRVINILELEVESIGVTLAKWMGPDFTLENESPYYVEVNEEFVLEARVSNALNKDVQWSVSASENVIGGLSFSQSPGLENVMEVIATQPGRYVLKAESTADTGPRADNTPPRFDQVTIVAGGLIVSSPGCVESKSTHQLTASIGGESISFNELVWDISGSGSIDSYGVFTAGGEGSVQIVFSVINQPELTYTINFTVENVCTYFTVSSSEFNFEGECVFFIENETEGFTNINFGYAALPRGYVTTFAIFSDVMSPDEAWSVTNPGWDWLSVVRKSNSPFEIYNFVSFEHDGARNYELEQEIRTINGADVRALSGIFQATFEWNDSNGDTRTTTGVLQFSGALPESETDHWQANCGSF